jgi:hypothetical protein
MAQVTPRRLGSRVGLGFSILDLQNETQAVSSSKKSFKGKKEVAVIREAEGYYTNENFDLKSSCF